MAGQEHGKDGWIVDDRDVSPAAGSLTGLPAPGTADRAAPAHGPTRQAGGPAPGGGITTTATLRRQLDRGQPADEAGATSVVAAEWALWGKEGNESAYRVLRSSEGTFSLDDFHAIITRYAPGVKETLPQYTVCWIPAGKGDQRPRVSGAVAKRGRTTGAGDGQGYQGYLAVGIHELADADPRRAGGRARTAGGREIEYVRLFCVRYAGLAEFGVRYADLVGAVRDQQLPADLTGPIRVELPETTPLPVPAALARLAENVATLLLTTRPVCVLGADAATADDRLLFIDLVMSLLPYGLRTTLSASTWASSTAQDLKLRLFFTNAKRDDGGWTNYVSWGQPKEIDFSTAKDNAPLLYLSWLRHFGSHAAAAAALAGKTDPVRFNAAQIRQMVADLPEDKPVADTLHELADSLRHRDKEAVQAAVRRLKRYLVRVPEPAERAAYRQMTARLGLLNDHPGLHPGTRASVYRVLLSLAFETSLSYASYCEIEDMLGGPPRGTLRSVMLKREFATFLPWLLAAKAEPDLTDEALMGGLAEQGIGPTVPLTALQRDAEDIRPAHRVVLYDFGVRYLSAYAEDPVTELARRGYLAETLEVVFPGERQAQRARLQSSLRFVYGGSLSRGQIRELFADPALRPTAAFEGAVLRLASSPKARPFIAEQAAYARIRRAGHGDDALILQRGTQWRSRRHARDTIWAFPRRTVYGVVILAAVACVLALVLVLARHT